MTQESSPLLADVTRNCASSGGGTTVSTVDITTPRYRALMVTTVVSLTVDVSTVNVLLVDPAATETLAGTLTTVSLVLSRVICALPAGAGAVSRMVAVGWTWPTTVDALSVIDSSAAGAAGGGGVGGGVGAGVGAGSESASLECHCHTRTAT